MLLLIILFSQIVILVAILAQIRAMSLFKSQLSEIAELFDAEHSVDNVDNTRELSKYELERLEREDNFDARINRLKEEVANQQQYLKRVGQTADELHPLVHNLPHNSINEKELTYPDVEYAR